MWTVDWTGLRSDWYGPLSTLKDPFTRKSFYQIHSREISCDPLHLKLYCIHIMSNYLLNKLLV